VPVLSRAFPRSHCRSSSFEGACAPSAYKSTGWWGDSLA
jgi:hypothetical protein